MTETRNHNIGASDYAKHKIQPWDIWLEYALNPWDADIVKRVLRNKATDSRRLDYEKIIHISQERIRQINAECADEVSSHVNQLYDIAAEAEAMRLSVSVGEACGAAEELSRQKKEKHQEQLNLYHGIYKDSPSDQLQDLLVTVLAEGRSGGWLPDSPLDKKIKALIDPRTETPDP
ncbi:MAG: hypothetical protein KAJ19_16605, partial [Gammaproteobacteria bacterium]|nr:hypothetical protein [Gammaproteobacteria bacterium]